MSTYILVHGAWHNKKSWHKVVPLLEKKGHQVIAVDLPGHGDNKFPFEQIHLSTYVDFLLEVIKPISSPVVLVGHSFGGIIISELAEKMPKLVQKLIYVAGFIALPGESMTQTAQKNAFAGVSTEIILARHEYALKLRHSDKIKTFFYNTCTKQDQDWAYEVLGDEPSAPFIEPVTVGENFKRCAKLYIECVQDKTIDICDQRRMHQPFGCEVKSLPACHSPFLSMPEALVDLMA